MKRRSQTTLEYLRDLKGLPPAPEPLPTLPPRYTIRKQIGKGGFGKVYLVWDSDLQRNVAVKAGKCKDGEFQPLTEAAKAANLRHPGIVAVYDVLPPKDGSSGFIIMELLEGDTLGTILNNLEKQKCLLEPARAAAIMLDVAEAVDYAHSKGIIHGDLKPDNILIDSQGRAHVLDFGQGYTPLYSSPTRIQRNPATRLDDVWSLGVVFYELLAGRLPFQGDSKGCPKRAILEDRPSLIRISNPAVPNELESICFECLQKNERQRLASARQLAAALRRFADDFGAVENTTPIEELSPKQRYQLLLELAQKAEINQAVDHMLTRVRNKDESSLRANIGQVLGKVHGKCRFVLQCLELLQARVKDAHEKVALSVARILLKELSRLRVPAVGLGDRQLAERLFSSWLDRSLERPIVRAHLIVPAHLHGAFRLASSKESARFLAKVRELADRRTKQLPLLAEVVRAAQLEADLQVQLADLVNEIIVSDKAPDVGEIEFLAEFGDLLQEFCPETILKRCMETKKWPAVGAVVKRFELSIEDLAPIIEGLLKSSVSKEVLQACKMVDTLNLHGRFDPNALFQDFLARKEWKSAACVAKSFGLRGPLPKEVEREMQWLVS